MMLLLGALALSDATHSKAAAAAAAAAETVRSLAMQCRMQTLRSTITGPSNIADRSHCAF